MPHMRIFGLIFLLSLTSLALAGTDGDGAPDTALWVQRGADIDGEAAGRSSCI